jgi:uncharacterized phage protein (TIGR02220 family)
MGRKRMVIFPLYEEVRRITATLSDEQMGKVIRRALDAYYGGESVADGDGMVQLATTMLLEQAGRYDKYREQQRSNAQKPHRDGEPSAAKVSRSQPKATQADGVRPSDPPNPIPNPLNSIMCSKAVDLLNTLSGSSFRADTKSTQRLIAARENEGYSLADIEMVIRHQCGLWGKDDKMRKYLRPETLFGSKFEGYLSDARRQEPKQETGYTLAPVEDPWETAVREGQYV